MGNFIFHFQFSKHRKYFIEIFHFPIFEIF